MSSVTSPVEGGVAEASKPTWWLAACVLTLVVAVYFQTWRELWPLWTDVDGKRYTHGPLIAAVSLWLIWRARPVLAADGPRPAPWAIPLVLAASLAWLVLAKAGILTLHAALWPVLAALALLSTCGWRVTAALAFPLGYLWFAVPLWDHFNRPLQTLTVLAVDGLNRLTRVPGVVIGDTVVIPQGRFEIAAGCSGLHFFVVALAIGALAGEIHRDRFRVRLLLLVLAAVLALVTNWLRVYFIILAGYLTDMQHYLVTVDHYKFGWVLFAVTMIVFYLILHRLPASPENGTGARVPRPAVRWQRGYLAGLAALCVLPAASLAATEFGHDGGRRPFTAAAVEGFGGPLSPSPVWDPSFRGADDEVRIAYLSPTGLVIDYYGNRYLAQSQGLELIAYDSAILDPGVFGRVRERRAAHDVGGALLQVVELTAELRGGQRWAVMYHYWVGDRRLTGKLTTQLVAGFASLWGTAPAGIRAVASPCADDCDSNLPEMAALLAKLSRTES